MAYIVLVEDDKDVAEVLCVALRAEGHRCFVIRTREGAERFFDVSVLISSSWIVCSSVATV
jgi:DNA-binding response OmpR family regulator